MLWSVSSEDIDSMGHDELDESVFYKYNRDAGLLMFYRVSITRQELT